MSSEVASSEDPRILQVLDVIFQLAAGNLEARGAPSDRGDDLDAIVVGVTMLAEEFSALQQETRRRAECLATLNEIARAIAGSLKMDTMLASIADTVQRLIPFDRASVLLLEQDGETMSVFALHAPAELSEPGEGVRLPVTPSIRAIAAARQGVLITDLAQEVSNPIYETLVRQGIRAGMAAPLIAGDRVVGAFNLGACAPGAYRNDHLSLLQAMADQIAPAVENARLHEQVQRHAAELERRVAERTAVLRESEARFRDLYEQAPIAYFSIGLDSLVRRCNRAAVKLLGYRETGDIVGRSVFELYPEVPEVQDKAAGIFRRFAGAGEAIQDEELPMRRSDGAWVWTSLTVNAVRDEKGSIVESRSIVVDVTERRQAEEALALFRTLIDRSNDAIEVIDPETGRLLDVNEKSCKDLGYTRQDFSALTVFDIDPTVDRSSYAAALERLRNQGSMFREGFHRRKDGSTFPVEVSLRYVRLDRDYIVSVARDITERKLHEQELTESEQRYRSLFEAVPVIILSLSVEGAFVSLNPAFEQVTGWSRAEWQDRSFVDLIHPDDRAFAVREFERTLKGETRDFSEIRIVANGGQVLTMEVLGTAQEQDGKVVGVVGFARDITERKQVEEALRQSNYFKEMLLQTIPFGMDIVDESGHILYLSPAMKTLAPEAVPGARCWEMYKDNGRQCAGCPLLRGVEVGETRALETSGALGGKTFEISHTGIIFQDRQAILEVFHDITGRKQREHELEALATVSAALRAAQSRAEMLPVILDQVLALLRADGAALGLRDTTGDVVGELGRGILAGFVGLRATAGEGVSGQVIASGQPYLTADLKRDPLFLRPELLPGDCAAVCVPLMAERQVIGVLWMVRQREFTAGEVRLLAAIADMAGNAVHRANLYEQAEQRSARLAVMSAIGRKLTGLLDLATVLAGLLEETASVVPSHALAIMLYDERQGDLWIEAARGYPDSAWRTFRMPLGQGVTGRVAATRRPVLIRNTALEPDWRGVEGMPPSGSELAVPLVFQDRLIGVLNLESQQTDAFGEGELRLVMAIGDYAAIAIQNARLFVETRQRLRWMTALHAIDMAITASLDLHVTFSVLLEAVVSQLGVDAAAVLQLEPGTQTLVYLAGRGFRSNAVERSRVRIGSGHAGRAALERRTIHVPDLREAGPAPQRAQLWATEGFVAHYAVPLIAKGEIQGVLELFHRSSLKGGPEWLDFLETLATQAAIAIDNVRLFERLQRSNTDLTLAYDATIEGWSRALELRDQETKGHTLRVAEMTERLARALRVNEREMVHIRRGALLHDIGKMGIPDSILLKPGPLTEEEWTVMRRHPAYAYDMLSSIAHLRPALDIPYCHHEKWDGTGYPRGLRSEAIPLAARIFAVVDVWDALTSDRPYRHAWPVEKVREYIRAQRGIHFDPRVAESFLRTMEAEGQIG